MPQAPPHAWLVIDGRRWRRTDPGIPEPLRQALVDELMSARRAVGAATDDAERRAARRRVHDAKVALGERGHAWWLAATVAQAGPRIVAAIRALLRSRGDGATIGPGEVARIVGGTAWRRLLPAVRDQAAALAAAGALTIISGGRPAPRRPTRGVLRYRQPAVRLSRSHTQAASLARDVL